MELHAGITINRLCNSRELEDRPRIEHRGKDTSEVIMNNRKGVHTTLHGRIV